MGPRFSYAVPKLWYLRNTDYSGLWFLCNYFTGVCSEVICVITGDSDEAARTPVCCFYIASLSNLISEQVSEAFIGYPLGDNHIRIRNRIRLNAVFLQLYAVFFRSASPAIPIFRRT